MSVSPPPVVTISPSDSEQPDESAVHFPEVFLVCAVTRAISRAEGKGADGEVETTLPCLPELSDLSLKEMFGSVLSAGEVKNVASGYSLQHGILVMKWVPHGEDFKGEPIFQVVIPSKFRSHVLRLAYERSRHLGVRKNCERILRHFFWPRLKKDVSLHIRNCSTYLISTPGRRKPVKLFHVILLQPFFAHSSSVSDTVQQGSMAVSPALAAGTLGMVSGECTDEVLEHDEGLLSVG